MKSSVAFVLGATLSCSVVAGAPTAGQAQGGHGAPATNTSETTGGRPVIAQTQKQVDEAEDPSILLFKCLGRSDLSKCDFAIAGQTRLIEANPADPWLYLQRGQIYAYIKRDKTQALADFDRAVKYGPEVAAAYFHRGSLHQQFGNGKLGIADFSRAIELRYSGGIAYHKRGELYSDAGEWAKAIEDYTEAIRREPSDAQHYFERGVAFAGILRFNRAVDDYTSAVRLGFREPRVFFNRGVARAKLGELQDALTDYTEAIARRPDYAMAHLNRGTVYLELRRVEDARRDFERAISLDPNGNAGRWGRTNLQSLGQ